MGRIILNINVGFVVKLLLGFVGERRIFVKIVIKDNVMEII
jgi:hypothetical protein